MHDPSKLPPLPLDVLAVVGILAAAVLVGAALAPRRGRPSSADELAAERELRQLLERLKA